MPHSQLLPADFPRAVEWKGGELYLLDQTRLPQTTCMEKQQTVEQVWTSIKELKVRGAPAIGVAAAYGLCVALKDCRDMTGDMFFERACAAVAYLESARPTAINLRWALHRLLDVCRAGRHLQGAGMYDRLVAEAALVHKEDIALCRGMGESGVPLIKENMGILTHCNAGSLATSELGTATAPMYMAHSKGVSFKVYADETRPLLQGARLTAWELDQAGIDVTLITDNMAAHLMSKGVIDLVIVGTDRVAANGDVANKIGTLGVAILASYFDIPFYVACPSSTIDLTSASGADIPIEERDSSEVTGFGGVRTAPEGISVRNPAFDVTPNALVTGLITENGIITAPYTEKLKAHLEA